MTLIIIYYTANDNHCNNIYEYSQWKVNNLTVSVRDDKYRLTNWLTLYMLIYKKIFVCECVFNDLRWEVVVRFFLYWWGDRWPSLCKLSLHSSVVAKNYLKVKTKLSKKNIEKNIYVIMTYLIKINKLWNLSRYISCWNHIHRVLWYYKCNTKKLAAFDQYLS